MRKWGKMTLPQAKLHQVNKELEVKLFDLLRDTQRQLEQSGVELEELPVSELAQLHALNWLTAYNHLSDEAPCLKELVVFLQAKLMQDDDLILWNLDSECLELLEHYQGEL